MKSTTTRESEADSSQPHGLSSKLRHATMQVHKEAETSQFMGDLFKGTCSIKSYAVYLKALLVIYQTLEEKMDEHSTEVCVSLIYKPELFRSKSLISDLKVWNQASKMDLSGPVLDATSAYCQRIEKIAQENPQLLVAHAYVRYLGDLSGGQMLAKVLPKNFGSSKGFEFYEFPNIKPHTEKQTYRAALDQIGLIASSPNEICSEAELAFKLNSQLFESLDKISIAQ